MIFSRGRENMSIKTQWAMYSGALLFKGDGTIIFGSEKHSLVYHRIAHLYLSHSINHFSVSGIFTYG